jgi:predicted ferric reductase
VTTVSRARPRVPFPRTWPVKTIDLLAIVGGNALLIVAMWVRHGALSDLGRFPAQMTALGQITALLGTYLALIQIVLMSRSPWLDQLFGMDRLANWHRWLGFAVAWLLIGHVVFSTVGWSMGDGSTIVGETLNLITGYPYILMAWVSAALFALVAITSVRAARRRLSYETWHFIHLYAYLAIALGFLHEVAVGTDFVSDPVATWYWLGLYVAAGLLMVTFRVGQPVALSLRHRLRVAAVTPEGPGVVSVYVSGRGLDQLAVRSGQYFLWRFLAGAGWWRAHPFSISAAPNGEYLRFTVKVAGDWTDAIQRLRPGTRVFAEGPYGAFTGARRTHQRVLLIAGGIGISPLRAMLEDLPAAAGDLTLIYRASSWDDVVFRDELDTLMRLRGATVYYLVGRRSELRGDPLGPHNLAQLVPDLLDRDVFICGTPGMNDHVRRSLGALGLRSDQIHAERFDY